MPQSDNNIKALIAVQDALKAGLQGIKIERLTDVIIGSQLKTFDLTHRLAGIEIRGGLVGARGTGVHGDDQRSKTIAGEQKTGLKNCQHFIFWLCWANVK